MVVLGLVLVLLAGASEAVMDTVSHHYYSSIFRMKRDIFWNPVNSWRNKYKDGDPLSGEAFFGATTFLVFVTDAWHLYKFFRNLLLFSGLVIVAFNVESIIGVLVLAVTSRLLFGFAFELCYKELFKTRFWR